MICHIYHINMCECIQYFQICCWNYSKKNYDVCLIFFEELNLVNGVRGEHFPIISLPENENNLMSDCFVTNPRRSYEDDLGIGSDPSVKCDGGDGNPLVCPRPESGGILVGIASCSNDETPDFYTNIAKLNLKEWIEWSVRNYIKWIFKSSHSNLVKYKINLNSEVFASRVQHFLHFTLIRLKNGNFRMIVKIMKKDVRFGHIAGNVWQIQIICWSCAKRPVTCVLMIHVVMLIIIWAVRIGQARGSAR